MEKDEPLVSIITSLYKGRKYIQDFLANIVKQTYFDKCELILIDANSPDDEIVFIKPYLLKYNNIKYERLEEDPGIYEVWNYAIKKANGVYITNANLDDKRLPNHIEECVKVMERNNSISVVSTAVYVASENQNVTLDNLPKEVWFDSYVAEYYFAKDMFAYEGDKIVARNLPHCSPVWKKNIHDKIGYFDEEEYNQSADWEFWLRASNNGFSFYHIKKPLAIYRVVNDSHNRRNNDVRKSASEKIIKKYYKKSQELNNALDFNTQFDGSYGKHRSGWQYVMRSLKPRGDSPRGAVFSSFIERDFGWNFDGVLVKKMLTRSWIGIAHAPAEYPQFIGDIVNQYPNYYVNKFKYKLIWKRCKGLFVLSEHLAKTWRRLLPNVKVNVLYHPTEFTELTFTMERYNNNPNKRIIQIGYWLRKLTSILKIETPENLEKSIIHLEINKNIPHIAKIFNACVQHEMNEPNYEFNFKESDFEKNKSKFFNLCKKYNTKIIPKLPNNQYDELLSCNIILFDFYDISASNLLIECIVRNTPILVKKHPAVVEYLGEDYPFYFHDLGEAYAKASNPLLIEKAHLYLLNKVDKYKFSAENFVNSFFGSEIYQSIQK